MNRCRITIVLSSVLVLASSAAGQSSAMPATAAANYLLSSKKQNPPCPPPITDEVTVLDVHKYLPAHGPGIHSPHPLRAPDPEYSEAARKAKLNGDVVLAVAVNENGGIDEVKVVCSSDRRFEQPALDAVKQWEFAPGTKDGKPVAVQIKVEMSFRLY